MGFFDMFKKKAEPAPAPVTWRVYCGGGRQGHRRPDGVHPRRWWFAQGILGQCCGIDPSEGKVYAPCDGTITQAPDTLHALGIQATSGVEILIHVGVDTVEMNGDGFAANVKMGDKITKGQLLLTMDLDKIKAAGHPAVVITVVTNTDDFAGVEQGRLRRGRARRRPAQGVQVSGIRKRQTAPGAGLYRPRRAFFRPLARPPVLPRGGELWYSSARRRRPAGGAAA